MPIYLTPTATDELETTPALVNGELANADNLNAGPQALLNTLAYQLSLIALLQQGQMNVYSPTVQADIGGYSLGALVGRTDQSGYWFSLLANNMDDPETGPSGWFPVGAFAGPVMVSVTTSVVALTMLQGANDTLVVSGNLSAGSQGLIFPAWIGKRWVVINNTTGSTLTLSLPGAGTSVAAAPGVNEILATATGMVNLSVLNPAGLPNSLPAAAGIVWNNQGALSIS